MGLRELFKKKSPPADRYAGKPLLKLVDSFVLKCIGELDPASEDWLRGMEPKLRQIYSCEGSWDDIVISVLHFGPNIRTSIHELWVKNQAIARQHQVTLTPMQFVEMFVEKNVTGTEGNSPH
jgi:hypothetical protein